MRLQSHTRAASRQGRMPGYSLIVGPRLPVDHSATFDYSRAINCTELRIPEDPVVNLQKSEFRFKVLFKHVFFVVKHKGKRQTRTKKDASRPLFCPLVLSRRPWPLGSGTQTLGQKNKHHNQATPDRLHPCP